MPKTYLAIDYGTKRSGLAIGNDLTKTSQALPALLTQQLHQQNGMLIEGGLPNIVEQWRVSHLIIGEPLDAHGAPTALSKRINKLGQQFSKQLNIPVDFVDERYSSAAADRRLRQTQQAGKRMTEKKVALRDSIAAQIILDAYFSSL